MAFIKGHPMIEVDVGAAVDKGGRTIRKFTPDMIQRMDEPPEPINPSGSSSGWVSERHHSRRTIPERSFTSTPEFFNSEESPSNGHAYGGQDWTAQKKDCRSMIAKPS